MRLGENKREEWKWGWKRGESEKERRIVISRGNLTELRWEGRAME